MKYFFHKWLNFSFDGFLSTFNMCIQLPNVNAMYKTRNTGTGKGIRGTRGIGGMLYSGEYRQTFRGMSSNIPGNVAKYSGECWQIFRGMSSNIPGNVAKYSMECRQTFRGMSPNIPWDVTKNYGEYHQRFPGMPTTGWHSNSTVGRAPKH